MSELRITTRQAPPLPDAFFERLIQFYKRQPDATPKMSSIWEVVTGAHQQKLKAALDSGKVPELRNVLENLYRNGTMFGLDSDYRSLCGYDMSPEYRQAQGEEHFIELYRSMIKLVGNSLGVVPVLNPEQPEINRMTVEEMLDAIDHSMVIELNHNGSGGVSGIEVGERFIPHKLLDAVAVSASVSRIGGSCMLEIGAGAGWLGYITFMPDYHTIDLPIASVIQAFMLESSTGDGSVWMEGEPYNGGAPFSIHGFSDFTCEPSIFDIAVNQDSFPELTPEQQQHAHDLLARTLQHGGHFLSINHESPLQNQNSVYSVFSESKYFRLIQRSPHWIRAGYVEEVYERI